MVAVSCIVTILFSKYPNPQYRLEPNPVNVDPTFSTSGMWEEAVHVYKSTPLEELPDLAGLALAYCRAGLIPESINGKEHCRNHCVFDQIECRLNFMLLFFFFFFFVAYERALAVASTEKEKAYILTALAMLQHRQGNVDAAKTLLFKW